jgi:integrase
MIFNFFNKQKVYSIEQQFNIYLKNLSQSSSLSPRTIEGYRYTLSRIQKFLETRVNTLEHVDYCILEELKGDIRKKWCINATNRLIFKYNDCVGYLYKIKILKKEPILISLIKNYELKKDVKALSLEQYQMFMELLIERKENLNTKKLIQTCRLLFYSGLRYSELLNLKYTHVDFKNNKVFIKPTAYNKKGRTIILLPSFKKLIQGQKFDSVYIAPYKHKNRATFYRNLLYFQQINKEELKEIDFVITPRTFRASFASQAVAQGIDRFVLQKYLGHSSVTITNEYYINEEITQDRQLELLSMKFG